MKKYIHFAILIIAFLFVKCSNRKANPDNKSEVHSKISTQILHFPESGEDTLKTSYFADTVIYVPLETNIKSFVGNIRQLWVNDSIILISCYDTKLLMFKTDGTFVGTIGKNGRGPGEYQGILHFDVILDTIYISDLGRRSLLRYTFDDTFCDEIKFNYTPAYFSSTADNKLACYFREEGKVLVYNKDFYTPDTIVVEYGVTKGRYRYIYTDAIMPYLQKTPSGLLFNNYLTDTIWNITGNKKVPAYIHDMKNKLPYDKQIEFRNDNYQEWLNNAKTYQFVHLIPFSSYIFIIQKQWSDWKYAAVYFENINTGEIRKFNTSTFIYDDIVGKQNLQATYLIYSSNYLITVSYPLNKLERIKQNKMEAIPSLQWLNQMKTLKENDNMTLALIKIKKNLQ